MPFLGFGVVYFNCRDTPRSWFPPEVESCRNSVDSNPIACSSVLLNEVPLSVVFFVFNREVCTAEYVVYPVSFFVFKIFPKGGSLYVLWKIVFSSSFDNERFESSYASGLSISSLLRQLDRVRET
jgi:hypothetical protein